MTADIPLLNASGCLDPLAAPDVARALDIVVTKTITPLPRAGNPPVRIAETKHGMVNSIGLQGPGIDAFVGESLPRLAAWGAVVGACAYLLVELVPDVRSKPLFEDEAVSGLISARPFGEMIATTMWDRGGAPLTPDRFIAAAERFRLGVRIDREVLRMAPAGEMWSVVMLSASAASTRAPRTEEIAPISIVMPSK